jgi:site-specific DNA-methyltransferase (adenine-specific)
MDINKIYCGDNRLLIKQLPDKSVDCLITSPPYWGLRDYKTTPVIWDGEESCNHQWGDILDNPKYDPRTREEKKASGATVGTSLNDEIWAKDCGSFCKVCNAWLGNLGQEPTYKMFIKHLIDLFRECKRVIKDEGTIWVNLGDTYASKTTEEIQSKSLCDIPGRFSVAMIDELNLIKRNTIIWHKFSAMPSPIMDRFTVDFEYIFLFSKQGKYFFDQQFEPNMDSYNGKRGQTHHRTKLESAMRSEGETNYYGLGRTKRCVWSVNPKGFKDAHFATYPEELIEPMILAGCPEFICNQCGKPKEKIYESKKRDTTAPEHHEKYGNDDESTKRLGRIEAHNNYNTKTFRGYTDCGCNAGFHAGVVLDPFMGSGTTARVAQRLKRNYIGFELNPDYVTMAERRLNQPVEYDLFR